MTLLAARKGDAVGAHGGGGSMAKAVAALPIVGKALALVSGAAGPVLSAGLSIVADLVSDTDPSCADIAEGCASVVIENELAARIDDAVDHGDASLIEGSATVYIGGKPAARDGDASSCGGKVVVHATRTVLGGPKTTSGRVKSDAGPASLVVSAILAGMPSVANGASLLTSFLGTALLKLGRT